MKKILTLALSVVAMLTSCQKEDIGAELNGAADQVTITLAAEDVVATRAASEAPTRYIVEVYSDKECTSEVNMFGEYPNLISQTTIDPVNGIATLNLTIDRTQNYYFLFWSDDNGDDVYTTKSLKTVTLNDTYDPVESWQGRAQILSGTTQPTLSVTLSRAVAKINLMETGKIPAGRSLQMTFDHNTIFNVVDGSVSKPVSRTETFAIENAVDGSVTHAKLNSSEIYVLAPTQAETLADITFEMNDEDSFNVTNVPLKANCPTNITGHYSKSGGETFTLSVDDTWSGDRDVEVKEVTTIDELNTAMDNDKRVQDASYVVNDQITGDDNTITIPSLDYANATRSITLKNGIEADKTLTITTGTSGEPLCPRVVYITVPDDNQGSLDIDLPYSTVYINGKLTTINGITDVSTLIIQENAVVENLIIEKGNVEIYGTVTNISRSSENSTKLTTVYIPEGVTKPATSDLKIQFVTHKNILVPRLGHFETITKAIEAADDNTYTIVLAAGDYNEALIINKRVHIKGPNIGKEGYSSERVPEANLCNTVTISADGIYLSGVAFSGVLESPAARVTTTGDIENLNLEYIKADGIGYTFFQNSGSLKNLVVEDSKIANIEAGSDRDKKYAFFIGGLESATFKDNVFDHIGYHALNLNQSADASSLTIENNTFTNCYSDAIQLANNIVGDIDIEGNTISNCGAAFNIFASDEYNSETLTDRAFSAKLNIIGNEISKVYALAEIGYAVYYNVAIHGHEKGYFEALPFDRGASIVFDNNKISLGTAPDAGTTEMDYDSNIIMLSDFYGYEGTVEFTPTNDVTGGAAGYNTWSDILNQENTMYLRNNEATVVKIGDRRYSGAGRGKKVTEITE